MFPDDTHRNLYLGLLDELAPVHDCVVHAYVLMPNHVHFLVTPAEMKSASHLMKHLGQRYVQHVNRVFHHSGSRLDGRYWSNMVGDEGYFLNCQRYIELNPVRAGIVRHAAEFKWSSYPVHARGQPSLLVTPHAQYLAISKDDVERRARYSMLVDEGIAPRTLSAIRSAAISGMPWGNAEFVANVEARLGRSLAIKPGGRHRKNDHSAMWETGSDPGLMQ
jgi:putative transposase